MLVTIIRGHGGGLWTGLVQVWGFVTEHPPEAEGCQNKANLLQVSSVCFWQAGSHFSLREINKNTVSIQVQKYSIKAGLNGGKCDDADVVMANDRK